MKSNIHINYVELLLILSIHENDKCILENLKTVKLKTKFIELMCVCVLEHMNTSLSLHKI